MRTTRGSQIFSAVESLFYQPLDGGLFIPNELLSFSSIPPSYPEIVAQIFDSIGFDDTLPLARDTYSAFNSGLSSPFKMLDLEPNLHIAELFHGPTLSFKDYALSFLGKLMDRELKKAGRNLLILTATSGDTGSAAVHGFKDSENIRIAVLHPKGKVSEFQRRQMTTTSSDRVFNIAVEGDFDDCQAIVKRALYEKTFDNISTANSINVGRIMAQSAYYLDIMRRFDGQEVNFYVPTGNFGNVLSGYFASLMYPSSKAHFHVCVNGNRGLYDMYNTGVFRKNKTEKTLAPAMDISLPSNFERLVHHYKGAEFNNNDYIGGIKNVNAANLSSIMENFRSNFTVHTLDDNHINDEIKRVHEKYNYLICPHTATATYYAQNAALNVVLATADPCKFSDTVENACGVNIDLPIHLMNVEEKYDTSDANFDHVTSKIKDYFNL